MPFHPSVFPTPKRWAGPMGRGSWALTLPRVPGSRMGVSSTDYWRLPWVSPSQGIPATALFGPSPELLPRTSQTQPQATAAPRSLNRLPLGPIRLDRQAERTGQDNPHRVFAPARSRTFEEASTRAYGFTSCRAVHYCRQADNLWVLKPHSTGVVRASPEVPNISDLNVAMILMPQEWTAVKHINR